MHKNVDVFPFLIRMLYPRAVLASVQVASLKQLLGLESGGLLGVSLKERVNNTSKRKKKKQRGGTGKEEGQE